MPDSPRSLSPRAALAIWLVLGIVVAVTALLVFHLSIPFLNPAPEAVVSPAGTGVEAAPTPAIFVPIHIASLPGVLNFSDTSVRFQRTTDVSSTAYASRVTLENLGDNATTLLLVDVIPKSLANDASLITTDSEVQVLRRDPILLRYVALSGGQKLNRELRLPAGGTDQQYITLVLGGSLDVQNQPEEFSLLYVGAFTLAQLDYSKLGPSQVQQINDRLNNMLNDPTNTTLANLIQFSKASGVLLNQYPVTFTNRTISPVLLQASALVPYAQADVPFEFLRSYAGFAPGDTSKIPLVSQAKGPLCELAVCEVRPGVNESMRLSIDFSKLTLDNGSFVPSSEAQLPITFTEMKTATEAKAVNVAIQYHSIPVELQGHVFIAPRKVARGNGTDTQRVGIYAFNNLGLPVSLEGCAFNESTLTGYRKATLQTSSDSCEMTFAGGVKERVEFIQGPQKDLEVRDASAVNGWRDCSDGYCTCEPLSQALRLLVEDAFLRDAASILAQPGALELLKSKHGDARLTQSFFVRGLDLAPDDPAALGCVLPVDLSPFEKITLPGAPKYSSWIVTLSTDIELYAGLSAVQRARYSNYLNVTVKAV